MRMLAGLQYRFGRTPLAMSDPKRHVSHAAIGLLVLLACVARLIHLDADPHFPAWISYVVDEGRWTESARNLSLFGTTDAFAERLHLMVSPGYQVGNYLAFRMFGIDFASARLIAALSGALVVAAAYFSLRRHVEGYALALGVVVLGFETNMLIESRLALPEIPSVLGMLLAYLLLVLGSPTMRNAFVAGLLVAAALAMKGTTALMLPMLPLIVLLASHGEPLRSRLSRMLMLGLGLALPLLGGLAGAVALRLIEPGQLAHIGARFGTFVSLVDPRLAIWSYFESSPHEARNLVLLGAWLCSWFWFFRAPAALSVSRNLYLTSGVWAGWWLVTWSANAYSPGRYVVHFIVPATVHIVAGLSLADSSTLERITAGLRSYRLKGIALLAWLTLPGAVFVVSAAAPFAASLGWDLSRVSTRIASIAIVSALLALAIRRNPTPRRVAASLIFPIAATLIWLGARELGLLDAFWPADLAPSAVQWAAALLLLLLGSLALASLAQSPPGIAMLRASAVAFAITLFIAQTGPAIVAPTYSIRDASRELGRLIEPASRVRTISAASLFLENRLRYRELTRNELNHDTGQYDMLVVFEHNLVARRFIKSAGAGQLELIRSWPLTVHRRYRFDVQLHGAAQIGLYRRRSEAAR